MSPVQLFEKFFSREIKDYILEATKQHGYSLTLQKLDSFLGIMIFSSFNERPEQKDYWSNDPLLSSEPVKMAMSRDEFCSIKSKIKYCLPSDKKEDDKIWKVRPVLDIFKKNIQTYGFFSTALSIDEMMLKYFGRLGIKQQFIKSKPIRYGI